MKEGLTGFEGQVQCRNLVEICDCFQILYMNTYICLCIFSILYILTYILRCGKEMKEYKEYLLFAFKNDFAVDIIFYTVKFLLVGQEGFQLCIARIVPEDDQIQFCSCSLT